MVGNARLPLARRLAQRVLMALFHDRTGPTDATVYAIGMFWLSFLLLVPPTSYEHIQLLPILAHKETWIWPALGYAVITPAGWIAELPWQHRLARILASVWWVYTVSSTLVVIPTFTFIWGTSLVCLALSIWLFAREGVGDLPTAINERR